MERYSVYHNGISQIFYSFWDANKFCRRNGISVSAIRKAY